MSIRRSQQEIVNLLFRGDREAGAAGRYVLGLNTTDGRFQHAMSDAAVIGYWIAEDKAGESHSPCLHRSLCPCMAISESPNPLRFSKGMNSRLTGFSLSCSERA